MPIDNNTTARVAQLANLALSDAEIGQLSGELSAIVDFVEQLSAVDTTGVEPLANVTGLSSVTRGDQVGTMLDQQQVLANAAAADDDCFLVPRAVER